MSGDVQLRKRKNKSTENEPKENENRKQTAVVLTKRIGKFLFFTSFLIALYIIGTHFYRNRIKQSRKLEQVRLGYILDEYLEEVNTTENEFDELGENDVELIGSLQLEKLKKTDKGHRPKRKTQFPKGEHNKHTDDKTKRKRHDQKQTNVFDEKIKRAESETLKDSKLAVDLFERLLQDEPNDVRILYGYAKALDKRSEEKRSNALLQKAIKQYRNLLQNHNLSDDTYLEISKKCITRMRFFGQYKDLISVHLRTIEHFPDDPKHRNEYVVTLLTMNRMEDAEIASSECLRRWPHNGHSRVLYGFISKTKNNDLVNAVKYLKSGIESDDEGVMDGRFYYHLGDALIRLGRKQEADEVHAQGARNRLFLSKHQRSLYNVDRLTGRPFWDKDQTPYGLVFKSLEDNWRTIRDEGLALLNEDGYFKNDPENLKDVGQWKQLELYSRGTRRKENCKRCPVTCKIIETFPEAKDCRRGQVKFSVMHPGTHVWPHCGPTNCRIRSHLGLKVPKNTFLRVGDETRSWEEGEILIFDDSFEHEVWHDGDDVRLVLIVDLWHPELTAQEKVALPSI